MIFFIKTSSVNEWSQVISDTPTLDNYFLLVYPGIKTSKIKGNKGSCVGFFYNYDKVDLGYYIRLSMCVKVRGSIHCRGCFWRAVH